MLYVPPPTTSNFEPEVQAQTVNKNTNKNEINQDASKQPKQLKEPTTYQKPLAPFKRSTDIFKDMNIAKVSVAVDPLAVGTFFK